VSRRPVLYQNHMNGFMVWTKLIRILSPFIGLFVVKNALKGSRPFARVAFLVVMIALTGCARNQVYSTGQDDDISLKSGALEAYGLAFITPSTVTGREQDRQSLALIFSKTLADERSGIHYVSLPQTLGAINRMGLADDYKNMYQDYHDTGIFNKKILRKVGNATGVRYIAQLKLAGYVQDSRGRFSLLGLRIFQTKQANIRLFLQIWDSENGTIAWEGVQELNIANDTSVEKPITFKKVLEEAGRKLIARIP